MAAETCWFLAADFDKQLQPNDLMLVLHRPLEPAQAMWTRSYAACRRVISANAACPISVNEYGAWKS